MKEKVILDKEKFLCMINNFDPVQDFEIKELKDIPILKVKNASLDDQIRAQELAESSFMKTMFDKSNKSAFHPKVSFEMQIFCKCVLKPKFTMEEVIKISDVYPELINRVCTFALGIRPDLDSLEK